MHGGIYIHVCREIMNLNRACNLPIFCLDNGAKICRQSTNSDYSLLVHNENSYNKRLEWFCLATKPLNVDWIFHKLNRMKLLVVHTQNAQKIYERKRCKREKCVKVRYKKDTSAIFMESSMKRMRVCGEQVL